ncbi:lipoprotein insertase outer membrane protein LolB [Psychrosphaera saromensis]|uniref:Outer-membrane lipoprotein LolB n=1 Tax=Psychrosphaera saromensis TaxID=716813 RepID=A0A2S7UWN5_9GAMM|nr:lipoprotein insertase outer membrane protein LolB [Psychrosphaera saromensis]PQJ53922.1 outer membrane lipoprotein LolB [Psychrosphaera saromensis]
MKPLKTIIQPLIIVLLAAFLSSCGLLNKPSDPDFKLPADINKLKSWTVRGKVLIKTDTENVSGYFYWHKDLETNQFSLNAFIGINILSLTTENGISTLEFGGSVYQDTNPTRLIQTVTGLDLPIENLEFWVRGQLTGTEKHIVRGSQNIKQFVQINKQQKWQVKYSKYQKQNIYHLPMAISLTGKNTKLKLSVSSWEFLL